MKSLALILLHIFLARIEYSVEAVRDESQGYCSKLVSYTETRSVPYIETYKERTWGIFYKTKYRWNYKIEYHTAWRTEEKCCPLYEKQNDECVPICYPDCGNNGDCISPDVCDCHAGYKKTFYGYDGGPQCVAYCQHSCKNGRCTGPDVCTCNPGYWLKSDGFTCEPICQPTCDRKSEVCTAPDTCSCRDGYNRISYDTCTPVCEATCINGRCTAPDTCTCDEGYSFDLYDRFLCKPVCDTCIGGTCTAPGVCTCDEGYSLSPSGSCKPVCSKSCHMGTCIAPETCMCHEGYGFLNDSTNICEPICPKACINGFCAQPDVCECHEGFEVKGDETSLHVCKPRCDILCEPNGECTAPNVCTCHEGYTLIDKNDGIIYFDYMSVCKPICENECVNGFCLALGQCSCWPGYQRSDKANVCEPICGSLCGLHSTCTAPHECTCDEGYHSTATYYGGMDTCEPICVQECINGFCSAPGECSCDSGYEKFNATEPNICKPICEPSCWSHSSCTALNVCTCDEGSPGVCSCKSGYVESEVNVCKPVCELPCWSYSRCTAPDVCTCDEGYNMVVNQNNSSMCEPICQPACPSNKICDRPGLCICKEGYRSVEDNESTICEPICEFSCNNGTCSSPNTCTCDFGHVNNENGSCTPHCTIDCGHGTCTEPDVCSCDEGYVLSNRSLTCVPYCESNCDNGDCVAPGDCRCHTGFVKNGNDSDSICVNACKDACNEKGDCIDNQGNCSCYFGWSGTTCEVPTVCVVVVLEENEAYETLSIESEPNYWMLLASAANPSCQRCLNEVNNQTICYKFQYDDIGERNDSAICFVETNSMCYATYSPATEVLKVSIAVGGVAVIIMIISIAVACFKFTKQKKTVVIGKSPKVPISRQNLLSEDNTNL
ncbi:hypothetical protein KPH14_007275 [Odynerus spinipes]|uniref:EGF-like domain-containing protein n=1 Tax=Odynerus spinipes TaxID=1348599 RepID=A0AAD9VJF9_9HYME|nr:hypothetical protein KPH14_007275 [Odynerus spinipes]